MAKFAKVHPGTLSHLRWSSLQQLVMSENCKGLHLSDELAANGLLKFADHMCCQTPLEARFNKKNVYTVFIYYMIISRYQ